MAFKLPNLTDKPSISKSSSVKAEYTNNEEICATDCFSFPPNGLKLFVYLGIEDGFTAEKLKANVECGVHYLLFFQTWYFSVQYFYFTLLLYQRLGQPLNLRSICMAAFNLKKSGYLILQTKRKYSSVGIKLLITLLPL